MDPFVDRDSFMWEFKIIGRSIDHSSVPYAYLLGSDEKVPPRNDVAVFTEFLFSTKNDTEMSTFVRMVIKGILTECLDQLVVLNNVNSQNSPNFEDKSLEYMSIEERFMGVENHALCRLNAKTNSKLAKDISHLINIIKNVRDEIGSEGTFKCMINWAQSVHLMYNEELQLLDEKKSNEVYIEELRAKCEEERLYNIHTIEQTNAKIQKLRFQVEDVLVYSKYEVGYFANWERARREQNVLACAEKENKYRNIIDEMKNKIELENRCHLELENYIEESKTDYMNEIQYWLKHYDDEIEVRELEMIKLKSKMETLMNNYDNLKEKLAAHREEIDDWLEYKRLRKERENRECLEKWAAVKIQAWWRGTMVRRHLGPYKKKGKGKKGKKK